MTCNNFSYWDRHPIQMRALAWVILIVSPILMPIALIAMHAGDIWLEVRDFYSQFWQVATKRAIKEAV